MHGNFLSSIIKFATKKSVEICYFAQAIDE